MEARSGLPVWKLSEDGRGTTLGIYTGPRKLQCRDNSSKILIRGQGNCCALVNRKEPEKRNACPAPAPGMEAESSSASPDQQQLGNNTLKVLFTMCLFSKDSFDPSFNGVLVVSPIVYTKKGLQLPTQWQGTGVIRC